MSEKISKIILRPSDKIILIRQAKYDRINHKIYGDGEMIYDIIIIGAGASGLAAAISAKQTDRKLNIAAKKSLRRATEGATFQTLTLLQTATQIPILFRLH